ncbi:MAG TPA: protein DpdJ [Solirubrobacterales bacterium]|nr:protein DpdJ [Solirubrobacterales bacterium]
MIDPTAEALSALERAEAELLSWGLVDGSFDEEELLGLISDELGRLDSGDSPDFVLDDMLKRRLVVRVPGDSERYRTRIAESVRLLARLRQLFTKHRGHGWRRAPRLVADFRFDLQPRRFPARDVPVEAALAAISTGVPHLPVPTRQAMEALLAASGAGFKLASFQVAAARSVLAGIESGRAGATMVSAGTGSGKTLAFYLPVLADIAGRPPGGPQAIAIYPRTELLKDQFSQTYLEARHLDGATVSGAKIRIGAFYGGTPHTAKDSDKRMAQIGWTRHGEGFACPFLRCPTPGCEGPLIWRDAERQAGVEGLRCASPGCGASVGSDEVMLTRERMRDQPPEVVFTTTEMLNRNMSSWEFADLIGIGRRRPRVCLIDEAHTYSGASGAQTALLLRRWHAAMGGTVHFVGLSATLAEGADFFSRLTGVAASEVELVEPHSFSEEGMEYHLILRGDPGSGTQLLSTTIQTAMLVRRVLDLPDGRPSEGLYGSKAFVFTDDLDVTNRLFHAVRDAEALAEYGRRRRRGATPLAALRATTEDDLQARREDGQSWDLAAEIGHDLSGQSLLDVTRVSSQDSGVDGGSDLIVATSSLEVGFNDPAVGAVIQHKAPRDEAAFIQRRGRAGRTRQMRPLTVVSLSDFGRDRMAYDAYDLLFDPALRPPPLPISNRAVLKMQATYSWLDWMARRLGGGHRHSSVWQALSGPGGGDQQARLRAEIGDLIQLTLEESSVLAEFAAHLRRALSIGSDTVDDILWEPPRALVTAVMPTALRRLRSDWYLAAQGSHADFRAPYSPLPDFVAGNLFSELSLPEVRLTTPPQHQGAEEDEHAVPILQALRTFAPGNVSLRFAVERRGARSWVVPPVDDGLVEIDEFVPTADPVGRFAYREDGKIVEVDCFRPWSMRSVSIPPEVTDSSSGRLDWRTQIADGSAPLRVDVPATSPWRALFEEFEFHTHNRRSPATVRRFAVGGGFETRTESGEEGTGDYRFVRDRATAALGFELDVDGIAIRPRLAGKLAPTDAGELRAFRPALFSERVATDSRLDGFANGFQRAQLEQIYLSALIERAAEDDVDLETAWTSLRAEDGSAALTAVAAQTFATGIPASDSQDDSEERRGVDRLTRLVREPQVIEALHALAPVLWEDPDDDWERWARSRFRSSLGSGLADACAALCPEFSEGEIVVDLDPGVQSGDDEADAIWLSERMVGGGGVIEELQRRIWADPRRFLRLVDRALAPGDFEAVDAEMPRVLDLLGVPGPLRDAVDELRGAESHRARRSALERVIGVLGREGVDTRHAVVAALNSRILRPGTSIATDRALRDLSQDWSSLEQRLGLEIETRIFAYVCRRRPDLEQAIPEALGAGSEWTYGQILGVLWPHGWRVRANALSFYNEFGAVAPSDAARLRRLVPPGVATVDIGGDWWERAVEVLTRDGLCELRGEVERPAEMAAAIALFGQRAIDTGGLLLHGFLERTDRRDGSLFASIALEVPSS